jgi:hypothetical protein
LTTKFTQHTRITPVEPSQTYKVLALLCLLRLTTLGTASRDAAPSKGTLSLILGLYRFSQCYSVVKHRPAGLLQRPASAGIGQQSCPKFGVNATYL